ncbi:MAG: hypothetical protein AAFO94_12810, partial [Bacteroidota bacterium]
MNIDYRQVISTLFFVLVSCVGALAQTTLYVDHSASGLNDGSSWTDAYTDLQSALQAASEGDNIWVAAGTYLPSQTGDPTATFQLPNGVAIYGGFSGSETQLKQRDIVLNPTILSGDLLQNDNGLSQLDDNSYTVVYTRNANANTLLDGFTISGGHAADPTGNALDKSHSGAGWFNESAGGIASSPTVRNCTFRNNRALGFGGAIYNSAFFSGQCFATFVKCTFVNNHANNDGGAVYNQGSFSGEASPRFENCVFENNTTDVSAGAMFNNGIEGKCSPYITNCIFKSNHANVDTVSIGNAGAIYNQGNSGEASPVIINSLFQENSGYSGGAIYNLGSNGGDSSPKIINSTFYANQAVGDGGSGAAVYNNANDADGSSNTEISNCIFWGNLAKGLPS